MTIESTFNDAPPIRPAIDRAMELMHVKANELPPLALEWRNQEASRIGMCLEVCLTAFAAYAEVVEGCDMTDPAYAASPAARKFFAENRE